MAPIRGATAFLLLALHTAGWAPFVYLLGICRLLIPLPAFRRACDRGMEAIAYGFTACNNGVLRLFARVDWRVTGAEELSTDGRYLAVSNHRSWADILVLQRLFHGRAPMPRFLCKWQVIFIPFLGPALWFVGMPFMRRYSRERLQRNPELRSRDRETIRRSCARLRGRPFTVLNFLEGTRFTAEKHAAQDSPYRHLLRPKSGGAGFILTALGQELEAIIDLTIIYRGSAVSFWDLLCGRIPTIEVHVGRHPIPPDLLQGDYSSDPGCRAAVRALVTRLWEEKDERIAKRLAAEEAPVRR